MKLAYITIVLLLAVPTTALCSNVEYPISISDDAQTCPAISKVKSWAYQLQNANPEEIISTSFNLIVIDYSRDGTEKTAYTPIEILKIKLSGKIPIAYISIGEAEDYRFYWKEEWYYSPPPWLGNENPEWKGNYAVKYWSKEWKQIIFSYLDKIINQGFCGVYLDRVDAFEYWSNPENNEDTLLPEEEAAKRMTTLIKEIADYCRSKKPFFYVIPQNGEKLLEYDETLLNVVSGWAVEDLFYDETTPIPQSEIAERTQYLDTVLKRGKPVLVVDYVDDGTGFKGSNKVRILDFIEKARSKGYIPYAAISDRELDELNIIDEIQQ